MNTKNKIFPFDMKNISLFVDKVLPLWSPSAGDTAFKRFNVEYIIRNNIFENDYRYELIDSENKEVLSAAFFARKNDVNLAQKWFEKESLKFSKDLLEVSKMSRTYIEFLDKQTFELMNDDDIKLSLFVSRKSGAGKLLLDMICKRLFEEGWKNLFLWTDCECNWQWYLENGYELLKEDVYEPFCSGGRDYKTYIFKKKL